MTNEKSFGVYLRKLRKSKKITAANLAKKAGLSQPYLSLIENGKRSIPTTDILDRLQESLEADPNEFMKMAGINPIAEFDKHSKDLLPLLQEDVVCYNGNPLSELDKDLLRYYLDRKYAGTITTKSQGS